MKRSILRLLGLGLGIVLSACGGSGGSGSSGTISGVAATGASIPGATVTLKCAGGTPPAPVVTGSDGRFSFEVTGVTLPCMAQVTYTSGGSTQTLHTYVNELGTANITPLTDMVVASLLGQSPATAFASFTASTAGGLGSSQITTAINSVKTKLSGLGVDISKLGDPLRDALVAATGGQGGNDMDQVLDQLKLKLGSRTLGSVLDELVAASPNRKGASGSAKAGYPATGTLNGVDSTAAACSAVVAADHSLSVTVGGQTFKATLDGQYFEQATTEIAPGVRYSANTLFHEARNTVEYASASSATPYVNIGLLFDAATGALIHVHGQQVTDPAASPAAGRNYTFYCAGSGWPSGQAVPASGYNTAQSTRFLATGLVGKFNTPTAKNDACSYELDAGGNGTVTWAGFTTTGGRLVLPADRLGTTVEQSSTQAKYDLYYNASGVLVGQNSNGTSILSSAEIAAGYDNFQVTLDLRGSERRVNVLANGSSGNAKSVSCSSANDPAVKWAQVAVYAGTWTGSRDTNFHLGSNATCTLAVASDGSMVYTGTDGVQRAISATDGWTVTPGSNGFFSFAKGSTPTADIDFTGQTTTSTRPEVFYWISGGTYEYCKNIARPS